MALATGNPEAPRRKYTVQISPRVVVYSQLFLFEFTPFIISINMIYMSDYGARQEPNGYGS